MSRIWKAPYQEGQDDVRHIFVPIDQTRKRLEWVYFVRVCSFTFTFSSVEQIQEYWGYYSQKIQPSTKRSECSGWPHHLWAGDHWERQTVFDRLPLYLREEPKRQKVVKALERAVKQFVLKRKTKRKASHCD